LWGMKCVCRVGSVRKMRAAASLLIAFPSGSLL
jgi:hypothetical protein